MGWSWTFWVAAGWARSCSMALRRANGSLNTKRAMIQALPWADCSKAAPIRASDQPDAGARSARSGARSTGAGDPKEGQAGEGRDPQADAPEEDGHGHELAALGQHECQRAEADGQDRQDHDRDYDRRATHRNTLSYGEASPQPVRI